jgi:hypothetical protein
MGAKARADLNEDGRLEVIFGYEQTPYAVTADGTRLVERPMSWPNNAMLAADLNGDRHLDVATNEDSMLSAWDLSRNALAMRCTPTTKDDPSASRAATSESQKHTCAKRDQEPKATHSSERSADRAARIVAGGCWCAGGPCPGLTLGTIQSLSAVKASVVAPIFEACCHGRIAAVLADEPRIARIRRRECIVAECSVRALFGERAMRVG